MSMSDAHGMLVLAILGTGLRLAAPILLAALGEIFAQRAGVLNIGIEGMILLGALAGFLATERTGNPWLGLCATLPVGMAVGAMLGWFYVVARSSQIVTGIVFNLLAFGIASYVYRLDTPPGSVIQPVAMVPGFWLGLPLPLFLVFLLAGLSHWVLFRTRFGLDVRAAGEHPRAADAAGLDVSRIRFAGVLLSCLGASLAGGYIVVCQVGLFRDNMVQGEGFTALAIVIFGRWKPGWAVLAALVFGGIDALQFAMQMFHSELPPQVFLALPYLAALVATSGLIGRSVQPASLGIPFRRGTRF